MSANESYIPAEDAEFRNFATTFANGITANPALYMLTSAQAASIQQAVDEFVAAYQIVVEPATKTKATVIAKENARSIAENLIRQYAMIIKENDGIDDGDKVNIGVRPRNPSREPIEVPSSWPVLNILGNTFGTQTIKYIDSATEKKARPFGASELQLFLTITADGAPEPDVTTGKFVGKFTRNPITVDFTPSDNCKMATYWARWVSARGETGPWSFPATMAIAA
jgi:hypothetical protein